jgi:hypothetical protein
VTEWPDFEKELKTASGVLTNASTMTPEAIAKEKAYRESQEGRSEHAMMMGGQRFQRIDCPILAIYASPHALSNTITGDARIAAEKGAWTLSSLWRSSSEPFRMRKSYSCHMRLTRFTIRTATT